MNKTQEEEVQQVKLDINLKNCLIPDDPNNSDENDREIMANSAGNSEDEEMEQITKKQSEKKSELDEVSEQGSELFETDSSCGEGQDEEILKARDLSPEHDFGQGKDIVAGSPTKHNRGGCEFEEVEDAEIQTPEELMGREEMNGIIVYDSYAKLIGCEKIVNYFENQVYQKIDQNILFSKDETKKAVKDIFTERARERDFANDQDRFVFKNLPRFSPQRDFTNPQFEIFVPQQQNVLIFDSRFENGNLRKVAKVNNIEYNLWLENDHNTKGHTQWYYFKVVYKDIALRADKKSQKIKFSILNLAKTTSLYQVGMKPCIWSKRKFDQDGTGWFRGGEEVTYIKNDIERETDAEGNHKNQDGLNNNNAFLQNINGAGEGVDTYFTLSFKYEFMANEDDELYFAHAIPSTYTDMQKKLLVLRNEPKYADFLKMNILCQTLAKVPVPLITITENISTYLDYYEELRLMNQIPGIVKKAYRQKYTSAQKLAKQSEEARGRVQRLLQAAIEEELKQFFEFNEDHLTSTHSSFTGFDKRLTEYVKDHSQKQAIVFSCRVHPGEPQASHMLDGMLEYLLSPEAENLRKHFVIRIVPMLNPDGVIYGNYRCSLLGCDLNRKWDKPNRLLHPPVYYTKNLIRHLHQERKVLLYCDLHGHSRKKNAFFYGCCFKNYEQEGRVRNAQLRIVPLMCCQKNPIFKIKDCRFRVEKNKESTARVVVFKEFSIANSFTLEVSFFAKDAEKPEKNAQGKTIKKPLQQISLIEYNSLGSTLCKTLQNYLPSEVHKLEFLSGKILEIFYDEFIKFVPPYILKREQEKQKKHQESGLSHISKNPKGQPQKQNSSDISQGVLSSQKLQRKTTQSYNTTCFMPIGIQGIRAIAGGQVLGKQGSIEMPSGTECDEKIQNTDDILEFESFMANLETQQNHKEIKKQKRLEAKALGIEYISDGSLSSGESSGDDGFKRKKKKKRKMIPKTVEKPQVQKKLTQDIPINYLQTPNVKLEKKVVTQNSAPKRKSPKLRETSPSPPTIKEQADEINFPKEQVMSSAQIQNLIQSQLSNGTIKQSEILKEIQKAIHHNKRILAKEQHQQQQQEPSQLIDFHQKQSGQKTIANAIYQNALAQNQNEHLPKLSPAHGHRGYPPSLPTSSMASDIEEGIKMGLEISPHTRNQDGSKTHQLQKDFKISRNVHTLHANDKNFVSGTFDKSKTNSEVIMMQGQKPKQQMTQSSQHRMPEFNKNDFRKSKLLQSITNPKTIKPILGLKNNMKSIYNTSQSQEHQKLFFSPQGHDQTKGFANQTQYVPHAQFGVQRTNEGQGTENLYIVGQKNEKDNLFIMGAKNEKDYTSIYRRASAGNGKTSVVENISHMINSHPKTSPKKPNFKNKTVMSDLKEQIAKESASMDLVQKQQQLQIQLERQQALLQQLQQQLNQQNSSGNLPVPQQRTKTNRGSNIGVIPREFINFNDNNELRVSQNDWHIPSIQRNSQPQRSPQQELNYNYLNKQNAAQNRLMRLGQQIQSSQTGKRVMSMQPGTESSNPQKYQVSNYVQNINVFVNPTPNGTMQFENIQQQHRAHSNMNTNTKPQSNQNPLNNAIVKKSIDEPNNYGFQGSHLNNRK